MSIEVNQELCKGCGVCVDVCPRNAISMQNKKAFINQSLCTSCQVCIKACPMRAIQFKNGIVKISENTQVIDVQPEYIDTESSVRNHYYQKETALVAAGYSFLSGLLNIADRLLNTPSFLSTRRGKSSGFGRTDNRFQRRNRRHR